LWTEVKLFVLWMKIIRPGWKYSFRGWFHRDQPTTSIWVPSQKSCTGGGWVGYN
jgi:hypothetical protein